MLGKQKNKKESIGVSFKAVSILLMSFGFLIVIISAFDWNVSDKSGWNVLKSVVGAVGTTMFSSGLVSFIVGFNSIDSAIERAMENILNMDIPLECYSESKLKKLKQKLACMISKNGDDINKINKSVYKLEPPLLNLVNGLYYEYHKVSCEVTPDDNNKTFKKSVTVNYKIVNNYDLENYVKLGLSLYNLHNNMTKEERLGNFKITLFLINDTDLTKDYKKWLSVREIENDNTYEYDYVIEFYRELQKCKEHKVTLKYEYTCSQKDLTQSWKLALPCKQTKHTISIKKNSNWQMRVNAFAAFYYNESELKNKFDVDQTVHNNCVIEFNEWTIPGAGYVISYNKK